MSRPYDMVVMGDINLDWVVPNELPFRFADLKENGVITWLPIRETPGGSGLLFALFAKREHFRPFLLGKVGDDPAGRAVTEWLTSQGIDGSVSVASAAGTGKAFIVRYRNDVRFLLNNDENANAYLTEDDIQRSREELANCRLHYVSGYCVKDPKASRHSAALLAMQLARSSPHGRRPYIIFDVVPHRIYETYTFDSFLRLTEHVDIMVSEVATMRRFLGLGSRTESVDRAMAEQTGRLLQTYYKRLILRYGPSGCDEEWRWDAYTDRSEWFETGHVIATDKRGFGDRLTIRALVDFFGIHAEPL